MPHDNEDRGRMRTADIDTIPVKLREAVIDKTPEINLNSLKRIRKRQQRCYELSDRVILDNPSWILVHLNVFNGAIRIDHAWLEKDGVVYDPVLDAFFDKMKLYAIVTPKDIKKYNQKQAARIICGTKKHGPWYPDEEK